MHLVHRAAPPSAAEAVPPFLTFVAGARAARVAQVFPAPYTAYLTTPTPRRHLIHVALDEIDARVLEDPARVARLAHEFQFATGDVVVAHWIGAVPPGFLKALGRIGEAPWAPEHYAALKAMIAVPGARLALGAERPITPDKVAMLAALPEPLRADAILRRLTAPDDALLLAEAYEAVVWRLGAQAVRVVDRWRRADSEARLFEMASKSVQPDEFVLHLHPEHPDLLRLDTRRALEQAGVQFRNCLATYVMEAASGQSVIYSWAGPPPTAVQISRDPVFGWRLEQARGQGNLILDEEARARLRAVMREIGVWPGRTGVDLVSALASRSSGMPARLAGAAALDDAFDW